MTSIRAMFGDDSTILTERNFQLLLLATLPAPLGTAVLSPVLESLIDPFGTTTADVGLMISVFTAPSIVMIPLAGVLSDRIGRKPVLVGGLLVFGSAGTAVAFTTDFQLALALRAVQGVGFAGINPIVVTSIGDLYSDVREATAQGFRFSGVGASNAVFPLLAGWSVAVAWQYPFLLYAFTLPVAAAVFLWFEEPTDARHERSVRHDGGGAGRSNLHSLLALLRHRRVVAMLIARGLPGVIWTGFITYNSIITVRLLGGTPTQAGLLVTISSLTFAVVGTQVGRITAFFDSRYYPLFIANLVLGFGFVVTLFAPTFPVAAVGMFVLGCGIGVTNTLYRSVLTALAPPHARGGLVSLGETVARVSVTLTPIGMGAAIAAMSPTLGLPMALRTAGLLVSIVGALGGVLCLTIAADAPPVTLE